MSTKLVSHALRIGRVLFLYISRFISQDFPPSHHLQPSRLRTTSILNFKSTSMFPKNSSILVLFCSVLLIGQTIALYDYGFSNYRTYISKKCSHPTHCCPFDSCSITHFARGHWLTDRGSHSAVQDCNVHYRKCIGLCNCALRTREVRSPNGCKCQRSPTTDSSLRNECRGACLKSRASCLTGTIFALKCSRQSRTSLTWKREVVGRCVELCPRKGPFEPLGLSERQETDKVCSICKDGKCESSRDG